MTDLSTIVASNIHTTNPLKKAERCDRCGAQAFMRATGRSGMLLFCGHHGRKAISGLRAQGFLVEDYTRFITDGDTDAGRV